jgi:hypothetical protein
MTLDQAFGVSRDWTTIRHFAADLDGYGQPVDIDEQRLPARFYRIRAHATSSRPAFTLSTGSGSDMHQLALHVGWAIARGLLGLCLED